MDEEWDAFIGISSDREDSKSKTPKKESMSKEIMATLLPDLAKKMAEILNARK